MRIALRGSLLTAVVLSLIAATSMAQTNIEFWHVWGQGSDELFADLIASFETANPDIHVNIVNAPQGAAQIERLLLTMAAGTPPDLIVAVSPVAEMALSGLLRPIDDLLARSEQFRSAQYAPGILDLFQVDGVTYGIPALEVGPWLGLAINVTLFEEAGLSPDSMTTLADIREAQALLTRFNGDVVTQLGFSPFDAVGGGYFPDAWATAIYDQPIYDSEARSISVDTAPMRDLLEYIRSLFDVVTYEQTQEFHSTYGTWRAGLASGNLAMHVNGYWQAGAVRPDLVEDEFVFTWMPNVRGDRTMLVGGWGLVLPQGSQNPEAAFRLAEFLTNDASAEFFFDNRGWLNANLSAMRALDTSISPGVNFFIDSMIEADRLLVPENIPNMSAVRSGLVTAAREVAQGTSSPTQVLSNLQAQLQAGLDEFFQTLAQ